MKISYEFNDNQVQIVESVNENDKEINIKIKDETLEAPIHHVRDYFEHNKVYTDVFFYTHLDQTYQVIIREEFYVDFILQLFKQKIVQKISWE